MSMLAEPRSRQKWSDDPRNTRWANDKSKFGYQMLTKMGWSDGKGLGQNECGTTSHIKVNKRKSNAGIGSKRSHDDDWIAHQNDFNDLLNSLNQGNSKDVSKSNINSLEDRVKSSKKKILYTKFVKSKDLSNASAHDLACIFGQRSKSAPSTPQLSDDEGNDSDISSASCPVTDNTNINASTEHGFTTVHTGVSIADYFAKKMAALKKDTHVEEEDSNLNVPKIREKKEKLKEVSIVASESESDSSVHEVIDVDDTKEVVECIELESDRKTKKKKKKKKEREIVNLVDDDDSVSIESNASKKKKKEREKVEVIKIDNDCDVTNEISAENRSSSKKKKKKKDDLKKDSFDETVEDDSTNIKKKRKKKRKEHSDSNSDDESNVKKKRCNSDDENSQSTNSEHSTKKKKKKK